MVGHGPGGEFVGGFVGRRGLSVRGLAPLEDLLEGWPES